MTKSIQSNSALATKQAAPRRIIAAVTLSLVAMTGSLLIASPAQAISIPLSGTITASDTGLGIENVTVEIYNQADAVSDSTTTDATGAYSFDSLPIDGNYTINMRARLAAGNYASVYYPSTPFSENANLVALSGSTDTVIDGILSPGGSLSGNLTFTDDSHVIYLNIMAFNESDQAWQSVTNASTDGTTPWVANNLAPGSYKVWYTDVSGGTTYPSHFYNGVWQQRDAELVTVVAGSSTNNLDSLINLDGPSNVVRLAGQDRFATSARLAQEYGSSDVVFVANGLGYPDALSAAPAAAFLDAPLLLTRQDSIPANVRAQIARLNPSTIYVIGGTGVVSTAVFNELDALATTSAIRLAGANRYATSLAVYDTIWNGESTPFVFLADGRNFPDALSSASAAAKNDGPVVLVNGGGSTLPTGLDTLLQSMSTTDVVIAGGSAVMSNAIETAADNVPGVTTHRYFGANRYETSLAINNAFFAPSSSTFLAVGSGYADALAGAAVAGAQDGPLYLVPGNCVPSAVLGNIPNLSTSRIVLLGGTGVLNSSVESLTSCEPLTS